jgi:hypothetical protein
MGKFRIRWGDAEIEYEGMDSDKKYAEAIELMKVSPLNAPERESLKPPKTAQVQRGGFKKGIFAPEIKKLVEAGFFKLPKRRKTSDVVKALSDRGIPVSGKEEAILNATKRLLRSSLKGTKTDEGWTFWQE